MAPTDPVFCSYRLPATVLVLLFPARLRLRAWALTAWLTTSGPLHLHVLWRGLHVLWRRLHVLWRRLHVLRRGLWTRGALHVRHRLRMRRGLAAAIVVLKVAR